MSKMQRNVEIPKEVAAMLKMIGVDLPDNVKEISTPVERSSETQKIILPQSMDKLTASKELKAQWENEENMQDFNASFEGWNWKDVLVAVRRVTEREFGWMNGKVTPGFFGDQNPTEIDVVVDIVSGKHVNEKAFFGRFQITGWEKADANIGVGRDGTARMAITAKRKYSEVITNYFNAIREQLSTASIYRGKNIVVTANAEKGLDFEIIENKGSDKIILNHDENLLFETFVIGSLADPGKRCYLFTGGYGTGKTESAMRAGREAVRQYGMSFFYLKDAKVFDTMLNQSKKYQPCIVFLEDIDEIAAGEQRDAEMNKILNTLDGVQTKGNDITVIFTTNHAEKISSALRRPGRIDLIIKFEKPNMLAKQSIYAAYFNGLQGAETIDYEYLAKATPEVTGAVIAEIAKRAIKLASKKGEGLTNTIVESCIVSMKYQIDLMEEKPFVENKEKQFIALYGELIGNAMFGVEGLGKDVKNDVESIKEYQQD